VCSIRDIVAPRSERSRSMRTNAPSTAVSIFSELATFKTSRSDTELRDAPGGLPEKSPPGALIAVVITLSSVESGCANVMSTYSGSYPSTVGLIEVSIRLPGTEIESP